MRILLCLLVATNLSAQMIPDYFPFSQNGKYGVIDEKRKVVCEPKLEWIGMFGFQTSTLRDAIHFAPAKAAGRMGLINHQGTWHYPAVFDTIYQDNQAKEAKVFITRNGNKHGIVRIHDTGSDELIPPGYDAFLQFRFGLVVARKAGKVGVLVLSTGKEVLPFEYESADLSYFFATPDGQDLSDKPGIKVVKAGKPTYHYTSGHLFTEKTYDWPGVEEAAPWSNKTPVQMPKAKITRTGNAAYEVSFPNKSGQQPTTKTIKSDTELLDVILNPAKTTEVLWLVVKGQNGVGLNHPDGTEVILPEYEEILPQVNPDGAITHWRVKSNGLYGYFSLHFVQKQPFLLKSWREGNYKYNIVTFQNGDEAVEEASTGRLFLPETVELTIPKRSKPFELDKTGSVVDYSASREWSSFPEGRQALEAWLAANSLIPMTMQGDCRTIIQFTVDLEGNLIDPITRSGNNDGELMNELKRLLPLMPKWLPGVRYGRQVASIASFSVRRK